MKHLKYLLFIFIVFITPNVFARDYDYSNKIRYSSDTSGGTYYADEILLGGSTGPYSIGTTYQGCISRLHFMLPTSQTYLNPASKYKITLNMANNDWRNKFMGPQVYNVYENGNLWTGATNMATSSITFVSYKKIYFYIQTPATLSTWLYFNIYSTNYSSICMTGDTNWTLSSFIVSDVINSTPTPAPVPTPSNPTPTPNNTQDIINSQNANTQEIIDSQNNNSQNIIDNNNQNTQDIIDNNNQNTQDIIDNNNSNTTCPSGPLAIDYDHFKDVDGKYLNSSGQEVVGSSYGISKKFFVKPNTEYSLQLISTQDVYFCLYRQNDALISCDSLNTLNKTFTTTSLTTYIKFSLRKGRVYYLKGPVCNDWKKEGLDDVANAVSQVNDTIKDDSIDNKTGFFTGFNDNTHGLTGIITLPLSTIQSLANNNCVSLTVPIPFTNSNVSLPCMTQVYQTYVPTVFNLWQIVSFGIISYFICLDIFKMVKGFKDPNEDKVEVLDL